MLLVNSRKKDRYLACLRVHLSKIAREGKVQFHVVSVDMKFPTFHEVLEVPNGQVNVQQLSIKGKVVSLRVTEPP